MIILMIKKDAGIHVWAVWSPVFQQQVPINEE